jgi:transposase
MTWSALTWIREQRQGRLPTSPVMLRELNVVNQRYRAVLDVLSGIPVGEVAERYGVARQTVQRWQSAPPATPALTSSGTRHRTTSQQRHALISACEDHLRP